MNANAAYKQEQEGPLEAARALKSAFGTVFLDSGMSPDGISIIGSNPDLILAGDDWEKLEQELALRRRKNHNHGYPEGAAIGYVAFDGTYRFGFYEDPSLFLHGNQQWITRPGNFECQVSPESDWPPIHFRPQISKVRFLGMVECARSYIAAGDIYQVCLAQEFRAEASASSAWPYYERLRRASPAPFASYLNFPGTQIASSSPECFLRMSGRRISTRPIKGTRPRKADSQSDHLSAYDLVTSAKEIAELVMITDLERNDLGRVCDYGSVMVEDLLHLEAYEHVFHLVSTVSGQLREGVSHVRALRECFPGGSISGAPKKRALEIIDELEPCPRGIYTGAIGYFGYNGESQFSIAIRTAVFQQDKVSFHVGAGIVADSVPEKEWQETLDKAAGLMMAAGDGRLS